MHLAEQVARPFRTETIFSVLITCLDHFYNLKVMTSTKHCFTCFAPIYHRSQSRNNFSFFLLCTHLHYLDFLNYSPKKY